MNVKVTCLVLTTKILKHQDESRKEVHVLRHFAVIVHQCMRCCNLSDIYL